MTNRLYSSLDEKRGSGHTEPILDAANAVIAQAREGFSKTLTSCQGPANARMTAVAERSHLDILLDKPASRPRFRDSAFAGNPHLVYLWILQPRNQGTLC